MEYIDKDLLRDKRLQMLRDFMDYHGLKNWNIATHKGRKYAHRFNLGKCIHWSRTISINRTWLVNALEESLLENYAHEIAHAIVGLSHGHDVVWRAKAKELGSQGRAYVSTASFWTDNAYGCGKRI
jgi:hypothetical protein